jgi:competence protein ComEA
MNGKERFAGAVLILTLAIGIAADVLDRKGTDDSVSAQGEVRAAGSSSDATRRYRRLDINSAGPDELVVLPGIGPKKAVAIVEYRDANGPFADVDQLSLVHGIGPKTIEGLRQYVCTGGKGEPAFEQ